MSVAVPQQEQTKLVVAALGIVLVSSQIKPLWRMACAVVGRIYFQILVLVAKGSDKQSRSKDDTESNDELKVSGLYIHPGRKRLTYPTNARCMSALTCWSLLLASQIVATRVSPTSHLGRQGICQ